MNLSDRNLWTSREAIAKSDSFSIYNAELLSKRAEALRTNSVLIVEDLCRSQFVSDLFSTTVKHENSVAEKLLVEY